MVSLFRIKHGDKVDIYDFGVILLEIISGRPISSQGDVETVKDQVWSHSQIEASSAIYLVSYLVEEISMNEWI